MTLEELNSMFSQGINTGGTGMGAFGMDINYDPDTYVSNDIVGEDTRPDFIKKEATNWDERQAQLEWYLENNYDPETGYKLSQAKKDRLSFELQDGQQLWEATKSDDIQTRVAAKNAIVQGGIDYGKSDLIKYGVPLTMLAGDIASGGMLSAAKNVTTGITEGDLGKVAEGVLGAGLTLTAKDIKTVTDAAEAAAVAGDWAKAAELSREAEELKNIKTGLSTAGALASGNYGTALLSGASLVGVDPVASVSQTLFGVDSTFDEAFDFENNEKFLGGWDVSAASEGIVDAAGTLIDTGGDVEEALKSGVTTYAREGGSVGDVLPDVNLPDWAKINLSGTGIDFNTPDWMKFKLGDLGIDVGNINLPDWAKINLGGLDLGDLSLGGLAGLGINFSDLNIDLPKFEMGDFNLPDLGDLEFDVPDIDLDIDVPDIDIPDVDIDVPDVDIDTPDVDIDTPEINLDTPSLDVDLPSIGFGDNKFEGATANTDWLKVPSIVTQATLLKMTPQEKRDYLDELLRSM